MAGLTQVATNLIGEFGYSGVAAGLFINALGIPIPSEIILPLAGLEVNRGHLQLIPLFIVAVIAQVAALSISYVIARYGGVELIERYGKYVLIRRQELESAERAFAKYGGRLVLFGLCLPALHGYLGYPAGLGRMNFKHFLAAAFAGCAVWTLLLGSLGYFLGSHIATIDLILHRFSILIGAFIVVIIVGWISWRRRKHEATTHHAT